MSSYTRILTVALASLTILACKSGAGESGTPPQGAAETQPAGASEKLEPGFRTVPSDTLTDQLGHHVSLADFRGKVWVADFIFTRCSGPCPVMSMKMSEIAREFKDSTAVVLVSFSVDPEYDTPERLKAYAEEYKADNQQWRFLTTLDKIKVWDLAMKGFALSAGEDTTRDGRGMIFHDERLVVVDRQGEIRGYVHTKDENWKEKVVGRIRELLHEGSANG